MLDNGYGGRMGKRMDQMGSLNRFYASIGKLITSSLDIRDILDGIMEEIRIYFDAENWSLMRLDPATGELFFIIVKGIDDRAVENIRLDPGEGIAGIVARTGTSVYVPDTSVDTRFSGKVDRVTGFATKSIIAVPIKFRDTVFGVIEIINRNTGGIFSSEEHIILQTIADFAAIAFSNAAAYEKAVHLSSIDPLTGLNNRVKLDEIIGAIENPGGLRRRKQDDDINAVAVIIDIDDFKGINDSLGHREGDAVLREASRLLRMILRRNDMLFRIGGDEFLMLVPTTSSDQLHRIEKRILKQLGLISGFSMDGKYEVRFSFGASHGPLRSIQDVIHRADLAMYEKKRKDKVKEEPW